MPIISTNDPTLHKEIKLYADKNDTTIGKAVEDFARLVLKLNLTPIQIRQLLSLDLDEEANRVVRNVLFSKN